MDFVIGLPISTNWKVETYNLILVIVNRLTKMTFYEPIKVIVNISASVEVIIKAVG